MISTKSIPLAILACFLCAGSSHAASIFDFENNSIGTATGFTDTVGGLSATFSSNGDPGGFVVYPSVFQTLTGNVLGDPGPAQQDNLTLTVAFNESLSAVVLDFATSDFSTPSPLTLDAYFNGSLVGTTTQVGQFLQGGTFPEGEIAYTGLFNSFTLSSTATDFAVDNIAAQATVTPEPGTLPILAIGLIAAGLPAIRRKRP
jgi:hypothetical protein